MRKLFINVFRGCFREPALPDRDVGGGGGEGGGDNFDVLKLVTIQQNYRTLLF